MAKQFDTYIEGLNELLRALNKLPKEANQELKASSKVIADRYMVPAWKNAAVNYAGPWGPDIADSVKSGVDRIPVVRIGGNRKTLRGGATPTMVRYPSSTGEGGDSWAPFEKTDWIGKRAPYQEKALEEWGKAVDRVIAKWATL